MTATKHNGFDHGRANLLVVLSSGIRNDNPIVLMHTFASFYCTICLYCSLYVVCVLRIQLLGCHNCNKRLSCILRSMSAEIFRNKPYNNE